MTYYEEVLWTAVFTSEMDRGEWMGRAIAKANTAVGEARKLQIEVAQEASRANVATPASVSFVLGDGHASR